MKLLKNLLKFERVLIRPVPSYLHLLTNNYRLTLIRAIEIEELYWAFIIGKETWHPQLSFTNFAVPS